MFDFELCEDCKELNITHIMNKGYCTECQAKADAENRMLEEAEDRRRGL